MDKIINETVNKFSDFLDQKKTLLKKNSGLNYLVSFSTEFKINLPEINLNTIKKNFSKSFYLEKPLENIKYLAVNEIFSINENGAGRFAATEKKIIPLKDNFISNWDETQKDYFPLFLGTMKFTIEHSDDDWSNFNDSMWFVPEILFIQTGEKSFLVYNILTTASFTEKNLLEKFRIKLDKFKTSGEAKTESSGLKVRLIAGNEPKDKKKWKNMINTALDEILSYSISKIVLSRRIEIHLSEEMDLNLARKKMTENFPECCFFVFSIGKFSFFGATPEKIAAFNRNSLTCDVLAGSAPRGINESEDKKIENELLHSEKNVKEHQFVAEDMKESLSRLVNPEIINWTANLSIKKYKFVQHLYSKISASLNAEHSIFHILGEIFPTSAVCGVPRTEALILIKKLEPHKRGLYSGITGWFNFYDFGEFWISIRSAVAYNNKIAAFAGAGIVSDSKSDEEFKETELKLKPVLSIFSDEDK